MAERRTAGEWNSSVTRVWPVFLQLLDRESTGKSWLKDLLELAGKQNVLAASMSQLDCTIAADLRGEHLERFREPASEGRTRTRLQARADQRRQLCEEAPPTQRVLLRASRHSRGDGGESRELRRNSTASWPIAANNRLSNSAGSLNVCGPALPS